MIAKYFVFFVLIRLSLEIDWECPIEPKHPQLGTTFFDGFWYEVYSINDYLNNDPCSHFHITCYDNSSCEIVHAKWDSYILNQLYNGTIVQGDDTVTLAISENSTFITKEAKINLQFEDNSAVIWKCNSTSTLDSFASLFMRMETQEDMEAVWEQTVLEHRFPRILNDFPAGLWRKNNFTDCRNVANTPNAFTHSFLVTVLVVLINFKNM